MTEEGVGEGVRGGAVDGNARLFFLVVPTGGRRGEAGACAPVSREDFREGVFALDTRFWSRSRWERKEDGGLGDAGDLGSGGALGSGGGRVHTWSERSANGTGCEQLEHLTVGRSWERRGACAGGRRLAV